LSNSVKRPVQAVIDLKMALENDTREVKAIALKAGVDRNTIWRWLDGKTKNPNITEVAKVLRTLGYELKVTPTPPHVKPWRKRNTETTLGKD
jgi:DNA-binding phage protein